MVSSSHWAPHRNSSGVIALSFSEEITEKLKLLQNQGTSAAMQVYGTSRMSPWNTKTRDACSAADTSFKLFDARLHGRVGTYNSKRTSQLLSYCLLDNRDLVWYVPSDSPEQGNINTSCQPVSLRLVQYLPRLDHLPAIHQV